MFDFFFLLKINHRKTVWGQEWWWSESEALLTKSTHSINGLCKWPSLYSASKAGGQLEVINLQKGDSVCDKWMAYTPPSYSHHAPLPPVFGLFLKFLLQLREGVRGQLGGGREPDGDSMWKSSTTTCCLFTCGWSDKSGHARESMLLCYLEVCPVRSKLWSPWIQRGTWKMLSSSLTFPSMQTLTHTLCLVHGCD